MDISEKYIKMCEKAEEIQNFTDMLHLGDFVWRGEAYLYKCCVCDKVPCFKEKKVWMPRQDQLQEMITEEIVARYIKLTSISTSMFYNQFKALDLWIDKLSSEKNYYADKLIEFSGEQLWLAFVMNEKYNKIWDGNDWMKKCEKENIEYSKSLEDEYCDSYEKWNNENHNWY